MQSLQLFSYSFSFIYGVYTHIPILYCTDFYVSYIFSPFTNFSLHHKISVGRATEMTEAQKAEVEPEVLIAGITDQIVHLLMIEEILVTQVTSSQGR